MDKQTTQKITGHETTDDERTTDSETEDECHPANPTYAADDNDAVVIVPRRPNLSLSNPQRRPQNPSATRPKMLPYQRSPSPILAPVQPDPAIVAADKDLEKDSYNVTLMLPHKRKRPLRSKIEARSPAPVMTVSDLPAFCLENTTNDQVECPYCHEILRLDESEKVANTYAEIKDKDKRKTTSMDRSAFCQLHSLELELKPLAIENGWPLTIDFDKLPDRVLRLKTELDRVIFQLDPSDYLSLALDAYRVLGKNKARSTFGAIARFEKVIPGYYGAKGASLILDQLQAMYKNILLKNLTEPQTPTEYMQQVLMPEVGYRLILQDLRAKGDRNHRDLENMAKKTMLASATFGSFMYPIHEGLDEDPSSSFAVTDSDDD
ncbi:hypothetical protein DM01DRAFT_1331518 [Hesseltinella vesiculosa]|uniref:Restriction of telomere capping protein 4 n=1 Tax=Hesseltinella vesiculosa TaxID=101127 RepID=A0A1X2GVJ4_9FUNG|nr:hypothetical protein DM01DRAFT_1331518 [Hesseltinella vesiculosa]